MGGIDWEGDGKFADDFLGEKGSGRRERERKGGEGEGRKGLLSSSSNDFLSFPSFELPCVESSEIGGFSRL